MVYLDAPTSSTRRKCSLVEISGVSGAGKTEVLLRLIAQAPALREARIAWVEEAATIYPCAFPQAGVSLERVLFVDCPDSKAALWAAHQVIRSQVFGVVVLAQSALLRISETDLRRLQLSAERNQAEVFLVTERPMREAWPVSVQLEVSRVSHDAGAAPVVRILKSRGGGVPWLPEVLNNGSRAS